MKVRHGLAQGEATQVGRKERIQGRAEFRQGPFVAGPEISRLAFGVYAGVAAAGAYRVASLAAERRQG